LNAEHDFLSHPAEWIHCGGLSLRSWT
jgi:hypothetical protein